MRRKHHIPYLQAYHRDWLYCDEWQYKPQADIKVIREDGVRYLVIQFTLWYFEEYYRSPIIAWTKAFEEGIIRAIDSGKICYGYNIPIRKRTPDWQYGEYIISNYKYNLNWARAKSELDNECYNRHIFHS